MFEHYEQYEYTIASVQLFLAMLGMGTLLSINDFGSQFRRPQSLGIGLGIQWMGLPLLACFVGSLPGVPAGIAVGLILTACVPTGVTGNVLTYLGRGNIALSVSLTAITTVFALIFVPLSMQTLLSRYLPATFHFPFEQIVHDIVVNLAIPLVCGMVLRSHLSLKHSDFLARWMIRLSLMLIVVMGIGAGSTGRLDPQAYGVMGIVWLVLFCLSIVFLAWMLSMLAGIPAADRLALLIKSNYRNISLAIAIKTVLFPAQAGLLDEVGDAAFFTILLYGGISLATSVLVTLLYLKKIPSESTLITFR